MPAPAPKKPVRKSEDRALGFSVRAGASLGSLTFKPQGVPNSGLQLERRNSGAQKCEVTEMVHYLEGPVQKASQRWQGKFDLQIDIIICVSCGPSTTQLEVLDISTGRFTLKHSGNTMSGSALHASSQETHKTSRQCKAV